MTRIYYHKIDIIGQICKHLQGIATGCELNDKQIRLFIKRQTNGKSNDNEWYNEWQRVTISANFSFFQIREEPTTKHPKENSLNLEEDLWRRPIELRTETSP